MTWIDVQVYASQSWSIIKRIPVVGLFFSNSLPKNLISAAASAVAVILGSIGVWLPASVATLKQTVPFVPVGILSEMDRTVAVNGELLILVPSLITPCAILLFGPWDRKDRISHQVWLLVATALLYGFSFFIVITQLSGGVADKTFLLHASWSTLGVAALLLYFYELLDRLQVDLVRATNSESEDLTRRTIQNIRAGS